MSERDEERVERITHALHAEGLDAIVGTTPANVLLLTGYWPVVGTALALVTGDGYTLLIAPEDERELAERGWADQILYFQGGSLDKLQSVEEAVCAQLVNAATMPVPTLGQHLGYENSGEFAPSVYAAMYTYGESLSELLRAALPDISLQPASALLARLRSTLTTQEIERLRSACRIAQRAFAEGSRQMRPGLQETEVAALFRAPLSVDGTREPGIARADGFTYCMSGVNSAEAYAAYQRSRSRQLAKGDFALIHCNSYADGYWTDITRTYVIGQPDDRKRQLYEAVFAARVAALEAIHPGARAAEVDAAARDVMRDYGFQREFVHGLGHGVGFAAINHNALPRLHPKSPDMLETGMVFNIEPAAYFDGGDGLRHCDMVLVTEQGVELLTPFQSSMDELIVPA